MEAETYEELQEIFSVSKRTIANWRQKGCRELEEPPYDVVAVAKWRGVDLPEKSETGKPSLSEQLKLATIQYRRTKTQLDKLRLEFERGKFVLLEDVKTAQVRMASEIKKHLLAMPSAWADQLTNLETPAEAKTVLDEMVADVLRLLHDNPDSPAD